MAGCGPSQASLLALYEYELDADDCLDLTHQPYESKQWGKGALFLNLTAEPLKVEFDPCNRRAARPANPEDVMVTNRQELKIENMTKVTCGFAVLPAYQWEHRYSLVRAVLGGGVCITNIPIFTVSENSVLKLFEHEDTLEDDCFDNEKYVSKQWRQGVYCY